MKAVWNLAPHSPFESTADSNCHQINSSTCHFIHSTSIYALWSLTRQPVGTLYLHHFKYLYYFPPPALGRIAPPSFRVIFSQHCTHKTYPLWLHASTGWHHNTLSSRSWSSTRSREPRYASSLHSSPVLPPLSFLPCNLLPHKLLTHHSGGLSVAINLPAPLWDVGGDGRTQKKLGQSRRDGENSGAAMENHYAALMKSRNKFCKGGRQSHRTGCWREQNLCYDLVVKGIEKSNSSP